MEFLQSRFSGADPSVVVEQDARAVVAELRPALDNATDLDASTLRLLGMAEAELGQYLEADEHLSEAHQRASGEGDVELAAECQVSLANVIARQGRLRESIEMLERVVPLLVGPWLARARSNLAAILLHTGEHDEALIQCGLGIETAEECGETWSLATLLNNRGLIYLRSGRLRRAAADFELAERLLVDSGRELRASLIAQNLAVATARLGDLRGSMALFETAMHRQQAAKIENASLLVDYAETMLMVGLSADAFDLALRALQSLENSGNRMEIANVYLMLARCAFANGDARADSYCEYAADSYRALGDHRSVALSKRVRFLATAGARGVGATAADPDLVSLSPADLAEVAILAAASPTPFDENGGHSVDGLLEDARQLREGGSLSSRLIGWCAEAESRRRDGRHDEVAGAVLSGIRLATQHAAMLGSPAMRESTLRRLEVLCDVGVSSAFADGDRHLAVCLLDEVRTAAADLACPSPLYGEAAELVAQHRIAAQAAESAPRESLELATALASMDQLERQLRRAILASASAPLPSTKPLHFDELCDRLGDQALLATTRDRGRMLVLVLVDGEVSVHDGGDALAVAADTAQLATALDRLAKVDFGEASPALVDALGESWRGPARRIDTQLFSTAQAAIGDRRLVVVPDSGLAGLAWATLPSLRGRPVELAPSPSYWGDPQRSQRMERGGGTVIAIGPDVDLEGTEHRTIASMAGAVQMLAGEHATVEHICATADRADTLLLSGHGRYVPAHPLLSSVRVADGELCWYDLDTIASLPHTIVWNACQPGVSSAGSSPFTTASHALSRGCGLLIAPVCTVSDQVASQMTSRLLSCVRSEDFGLRVAQFQAECHDDPQSWTGLGFVSVGQSRRS